MKTITNEIKAKYYNQYQFSYVCFEGISNSIWSVGVSVVFGYYVTNGDRGKIDMDNVSALELTSLEQISDNDAIEVAKMFGYKETETLPLFVLKQKGRSISERFIDKQYASINGFTYIIKIYQYLQSKGYALPYGDYSVEDLVELGVIKLK